MIKKKQNQMCFFTVLGKARLLFVFLKVLIIAGANRKNILCGEAWMDFCSFTCHCVLLDQVPPPCVMSGAVEALVTAGRLTCEMRGNRQTFFFFSSTHQSIIE